MTFAHLTNFEATQDGDLYVSVREEVDDGAGGVILSPDEIIYALIDVDPTHDLGQLVEAARDEWPGSAGYLWRAISEDESRTLARWDRRGWRIV